MDLNKMTLVGSLARDPEERKDNNGRPCAAFTVVTNRLWKDEKTRERREEIDFHAVVAYGKLGEIVTSYLKKGAKVYVEGRLSTRTWTARDGQRRMLNEIIADNLIMLGARHQPKAA